MCNDNTIPSVVPITARITVVRTPMIIFLIGSPSGVGNEVVEGLGEANVELIHLPFEGM